MAWSSPGPSFHGYSGHFTCYRCGQIICYRQNRTAHLPVGPERGMVRYRRRADMTHFLQDITICVAAAWLLGLLAHLIRQPPLLAYLLGGFVVGPAGLGLVKDPDSIEMIAELGLIFLLFMIGLEIDLKKIVSAGRSITVTAAAQIVGGLLLGLALAAAVGLPL